jgi:hypothetical protein
MINVTKEPNGAHGEKKTLKEEISEKFMRRY